jgi:putative ABC transport system substrate-binding protein
VRFLILLLFAGSVFAQPPGKTWRLGFLSTVGPEASAGVLGGFREHMRAFGYVEGKNLTIEHRWPTTTFDKDPAPVNALVQGKPDVIVAWATPATIAARRATSTIPIVFVGNSDPVGSGLVRSLARPGGNITGVSNIGVELAAKQVELVVELLPGTKRLGVIVNPANSAAMAQFEEVKRAIRALGLQSEVANARSGEEYDNAFKQFAKSKMNAVLIVPDPSVLENRQRIAVLALKLRLPTFFQREENVKAGGLVSYGPNLTDQLRQTARFVDKILKGARPADLPIEQPERVELVLNATTAKALRIAVPPAVQFRAQVVE